MIQLQHVNFEYKGSAFGSIRDLSLSVRQGEVILLCGASGSGKTTILRLINGLIPHFYNGTLSGEVTVCGKVIAQTGLHELAGIVGTVFQNPRSQFFSVDTDGEIVFGPENIGLAPDEILRRKAQVVQEMDLQPLLQRSLFQLSGGEKQKIACASVAALFPEVILLDEPSSNLDWKAIGELRRIIGQWKAQGKTILISEHRLWYINALADRVLYLKDGAISQEWRGDDFFSLDPETFRRLQLRPATIARSFLNTQKEPVEAMPSTDPITLHDYYFCYEQTQHLFRRHLSPHDTKEPLALSIPSLTLPYGRVIGLIGHNGAGKSTFLRCICGLEKRCPGRITLGGQTIRGKHALSACYLVMQDVNHQLFTDSVLSEVLLSMDSPDPERAGEILTSLGLQDYAETHPMALSGGQKQRVAIASAIAANASILLFDEPTSGLDYIHMCAVASLLSALSAQGKTILVSTHDPELLTLCADEIVQLDHGQLAAQYPLDDTSLPRLKAFFEGSCS
ncbi:MAG: ABC transporter ATP-binding protein [Lachnospiraceae bacterium]|nr:ABC transporter ATP-binding protein [Lachnospiraceae bacterium]